jgi:hypothetical protein
VVSGTAGAELLDSYEAERIPVAQRLLSSTDRGFALVVSDSWQARLLRTRVAPRILAAAMRIGKIRELAFRTISQIGISYPESPLSETLPGVPRTAPRGGARFPWLRLRLSPDGPVEDFYEKLDDTRFALILIGQPAPPPDALPDLGDLLRIQVIPSDPSNDRVLARAKIPRPAFYLLRPDGHIGVAGTRFDAGAVRRYVEDRVMGASQPTSLALAVPFRRMH